MTRIQRVSLAVLVTFGNLGASTAFGQGATCVNSAGTAVTWTRWECRFEVQGAFTGRKGYAETKLKVLLGPVSDPGSYSTYAYWDGGVGSAGNKAKFVIRFAFPKVSSSSPTNWTWSTSCETPTTCGPTSGTTPSLVTSGSVVVNNYSGSSVLYNHGFLTAIQLGWQEAGVDRWWSTLRYPPNTPAVWVGDSPWAAPLKASAAEWLAYVQNRMEDPSNLNSKGLTVLQVGLAPSWVATSDSLGNLPFSSISNCTPSDPVGPSNCSVPSPAFWQNFDDKVNVANLNGLQVFLAGLMEPLSNHPGTTGPEDFPAAAEARTFARWFASRMTGNHVIFSPGFDAPPITKNSQQLQRYVGQEIDLVAPNHLKTNHWGTVTTGLMDDLHNDSWLDFQMFQSGHNQQKPDNAPVQLSLLTARARTLAWQMSGTSTPGVAPFVSNQKPAVNGEAIYDQNQVPNSNYISYRGRQAAYLSWLSGAFGATFGIGGVWDWGVCGASATNACGYRMPVNYRSYSQALDRGISIEMKHMANLIRAYQANNLEYLDSFEQWRILNNPAAEEKKMVVARGSDFALAYLPHNDKIRLDTNGLNLNPDAGYLFNPADGVISTVRLDANNPKYTCGSGWCEWENRFYSAPNPAVSDRVFYIVASSPSSLWSAPTSGVLDVLSGALRADDLSVGPWGIIGRLGTSNGEPMDGLFYISSVQGAVATEPAAASDGAGKVFVAWQTNEDADGWQEIRGQWVGQSGQLLGDAIRVSPVEERDQLNPSVAVDAQGNAVVTWTVSDAIPGSLSEIWGQAIDGAGRFASAPLQLAAGGGYDHSRARVASDRYGSLTLCWIRRDGGASAYSLMARKFNSALTPSSAEIELTSGVGLSPWLRPIGIDDQGQAEVLWEDRTHRGGRGLYLQRLDSRGRRVGGVEAK